MYFCPKKQNNFQYILKEKNTFQHLSHSVNIEPVSDGLKRELQVTSDGSHTLYMPDMDEHYHSVNGAIQESEHVFIEAGLHRLSKKEIRVLEIGFGTGLNAFLTLLDSRQSDRHITYYSMELYPLDIALVQNLNYGKVLCAGEEDMFMALHEAPWNQSASITPNLRCTK
jgi:tRNA U34 5-methylaminomethyl-2-thiouridine-forming methyltransferase MnmC